MSKMFVAHFVGGPMDGNTMTFSYFRRRITTIEVPPLTVADIVESSKNKVSMIEEIRHEYDFDSRTGKHVWRGIFK